MVNDCAFEVVPGMFGQFGVLLCNVGGTGKFFETADVSTLTMQKECLIIFWAKLGL